MVLKIGQKVIHNGTGLQGEIINIFGCHECVVKFAHIGNHALDPADLTKVKRKYTKRR